MTHIKQEAYDKFIKTLKNNRDDVYFKIKRNKALINDLAKEHRLLKKEFTIIIENIKEIISKNR